MRLIDADALRYSRGVDVNGIIYVPLKDINKAPTVDAEPMKHGHWVEMERGHYYKCSECRNPIPYKFGWRFYNGVVANKRYYNYCPNCGAKMDEEEPNERTAGNIQTYT